MERKINQEIHIDEENVAAGLDWDAWMNSLKKRVNFSSGIDGPKHEEHLIYRVHSHLREGNESCYESIVASICPYHRGKEHLLHMETQKERYVFHVLSRNKNVTFEHLVNMMKEREKRVRRCYPGKIELERKAFVEMMLLDGCFIVELLLKSEYGGYGKDDLMDGPGWRLVNLCSCDLLLLENQLPFFLLQEIFEVVMPNAKDPAQAFVKLSLKSLKHTGLTQTQNEQVNHPIDSKSIHHLLHLWHTHLIPFPAKELQDSKILNLAPCLGIDTIHEEKQEPDWMPGVKQLEEAGVKFKAASKNLLDIEFCNGELLIPKISVLDETETQLRNLIAFEQCCLRPSDYYISSYVQFLDDLISTSRDVEILRKKGVLKHGFVDNEQVVRLYNKLMRGLLLTLEESYLYHTFKMVNAYSNRRRTSGGQA